MLLEDLAIRDRLPYDALVHLPVERLAASLILAWDEVDAQQALLDGIGNDTGQSGISYEIIHETSRFRILLSGPYSQISRMASEATRVAKEYAKLLTKCIGVKCNVSGMYPPNKPDTHPTGKGE
jgi:hypothetical protein